jgi:hypothetical protein
MTIKSKMTGKIAVISSLILTSITIFDTTSVIAGTPSPRSVIQTGKLLEEFFYGAAKGAGNKVGEGAVVLTGAALANWINSGNVYTKKGLWLAPNGLNYKVCQNFQYEKPISVVYYCNY